jgi:hypothetical protein
VVSVGHNLLEDERRHVHNYQTTAELLADIDELDQLNEEFRYQLCHAQKYVKQLKKEETAKTAQSRAESDALTLRTQERALRTNLLQFTYQLQSLSERIDREIPGPPAHVLKWVDLLRKIHDQLMKINNRQMDMLGAAGFEESLATQTPSSQSPNTAEMRSGETEMEDQDGLITRVVEGAEDYVSE